MTLSQRVRELAAENRISETMIAIKTGVTPQTVKMWFEGTKEPYASLIGKLAQVFGLSDADFLEGVDGVVRPAAKVAGSNPASAKPAAAKAEPAKAEIKESKPEVKAPVKEEPKNDVAEAMPKPVEPKEEPKSEVKPAAKEAPKRAVKTEKPAPAEKPAEKKVEKEPAAKEPVKQEKSIEAKAEVKPEVKHLLLLLKLNPLLRIRSLKLLWRLRQKQLQIRSKRSRQPSSIRQSFPRSGQIMLLLSTGQVNMPSILKMRSLRASRS